MILETIEFTTSEKDFTKEPLMPMISAFFGENAISTFQSLLKEHEDDNNLLYRHSYYSSGSHTTVRLWKTEDAYQRGQKLISVFFPEKLLEKFCNEYSLTRTTRKEEI